MSQFEAPSPEAQAYHTTVVAMAEMCCRRSKETGLSTSEVASVFFSDVAGWLALLSSTSDGPPN